MRTSLSKHLNEYVLCKGWIGEWEDFLYNQRRNSLNTNKQTTLSKYRKSIKAWEFGYGNAIFEIVKKKTNGKEVLLDGM